MTEPGRIIRRATRAEKQFTQIRNEWIDDGRISLKAFGLLAFIWRQKPDTTITIKGMADVRRESAEALTSAARELEQFGYLQRHPRRGVGAQRLADDWVICDPWDLELAPVDNRSVEAVPQKAARRRVPVDNRSTVPQKAVRTVPQKAVAVRRLDKTINGHHTEVTTEPPVDNSPGVRRGRCPGDPFARGVAHELGAYGKCIYCHTAWADCT